MDRWWATIDLTAEGGVIWAGDSVPEWFDIAQDLTERWVHQMQIRWELNAGPAVEPAASFAVESDAAWRLLTGAKYDDGAVTISGDTRLAGGLLGMRGIIV
ncbi:hypothetical protein GCM10027403_13510 [Arthrobacter tecti]